MSLDNRLSENAWGAGSRRLVLAMPGKDVPLFEVTNSTDYLENLCGAGRKCAESIVNRLRREGLAVYMGGIYKIEAVYGAHESRPETLVVGVSPVCSEELFSRLAVKLMQEARGKVSRLFNGSDVKFSVTYLPNKEDNLSRAYDPASGLYVSGAMEEKFRISPLDWLNRKNTKLQPAHVKLSLMTDSMFRFRMRYK